MAKLGSHSGSRVMVQTRLSKALIDYRDSNELSLFEAAKRFGLGITVLQTIERGGRVYTDTFFTICKMLNLPPDESLVAPDDGPDA